MQTRVAQQPADKTDPGIGVKEHDLVRLVRRVIDEERAYDVGAAGTVVHVYEDGQAFEVEFNHPANAVVTVERGDVERLSD